MKKKVPISTKNTASVKFNLKDDGLQQKRKMLQMAESELIRRKKEE